MLAFIRDIYCTKLENKQYEKQAKILDKIFMFLKGAINTEN